MLILPVLKKDSFAVTIWGDNMRQRKRFFVLCILVVLMCALLLTGCTTLNVFNHFPTHQPNTFWETEDGRVSFYTISSDESAYGTLQTEDGPVGIALDMSSFFNQFRCRVSVEAEIKEEQWTWVKVSSKRFVVEVIESNYFESGERLVFHRQDDVVLPDDFEATIPSVLRKLHFTLEDFAHLTIGESTMGDVHAVGTYESGYRTEEGLCFDYPAENGGYIRIILQGDDLIVGVIEEIDPTVDSN